MQATLHVGVPLVVEAPSPDGTREVVFEDDGETGYFYALDLTQKDNPIQEAMHIDNVRQVTDRSLPPGSGSSGRARSARPDFGSTAMRMPNRFCRKARL